MTDKAPAAPGEQQTWRLDRRRVGILGEEETAGEYRRLGYDIFDANYHSPFGELDLVAAKENTLVFIEVRTRDSDSDITPAETVDAHKQRRLVATAKYYLAAFPEAAERDIRFDVVEVFYEGGYRCRIHRIENAFTL